MTARGYNVNGFVVVHLAIQKAADTESQTTDPLGALQGHARPDARRQCTGKRCPISRPFTTAEGLSVLPSCCSAPRKQ